MDFFKCILFGVLLHSTLISCSNNIESGKGDDSVDSVLFLLKYSARLPDSLSNEVHHCAERALRLAQENERSSDRFEALYNMGAQAERIGNYDLATTYFLESLKYSKKNNITKTGNVYNYIAQIAFKQGKYDVSMEFFPKALVIRKQMNDSEGQASSYLNIGSVYQKEEKYSEAEEQYRLSLRIYSELSDSAGMANCYTNLGALYFQQDHYEKAIEYYRQAEEFYRKQHQTAQLFSVLSNIGMVYGQTGNTSEARNYYSRTLRAANQLPSSESAVAQTYCSIGIFYEELNQADSAIFYFNRAIDIASGSNLYEVLETTLERRGKLYARDGRYQDAYDDHIAYKSAYDTINNTEKVKAFAEKAAQYKFDIRQQEQLFRNRMQRIFIVTLVIILLLICVLAINYYKSFVRKKKDNILLAKQKEEITDSIRYAGLIQKSTLPSKEYAESILPEHFIFSRPRDIVSGDFYWMTKKNNFTIVAVADCTGHGVPGAIVSMLGISSLDKIVAKMEIPQADGILNRLREEIIRLLNPEGSTEVIQDGMDIALVVIDKDKNEVEYAGAYNPLYLIRNNTLIEKKANRMPIGLFVKKNESFTASRFSYMENDTMYLFSDGYIDQFGGDHGEKFKSRKFKEMLLVINEKPMEEQCRILNENYLNWKGGYPQIDDILIVGIKL